MIATWPPKHRHNTKRLRKAINARVQTDALADFMAATYKSTREAAERLQAMRAAITKAITDIDSLRADPAPEALNSHLTNIHNSLAAVIDESDRA